MDGSGSGGDKLFGRFTEPAHRVLDLAREEAERAGHRYLGPEHVLTRARSPRATAGPLGCCGLVGWTWRRPGPRWLAWPSGAGAGAAAQ